MIINYNKLIRDKIPSILELKGLKYKVENIKGDQEFFEKLKNKLLEETQEFIENPSLEELIDIWQVLDTLIEIMGYLPLDVYRKLLDKNKSNGGFKNRIFLKWIDHK